MINEENIKNFAKLSDEEVKQKISEAAKAGNISPERLKNTLSNPAKIKSVISKMTPADIERMLRIIGKDNAEKMADELKKNL